MFVIVICVSHFKHAQAIAEGGGFRFYKRVAQLSVLELPIIVCVRLSNKYYLGNMISSTDCAESLIVNCIAL